MKEVSFFVLGAQKSGTTYFHGLLSNDDRISLPIRKETQFFSDNKGEFGNGLSFYIDKYYGHSSGEAILGEIDPEYLYFPKVPQRLYDAYPNARLIILFRDPVKRAFSHYVMSYRRGTEVFTFEDALKLEDERISTGNIGEQSRFSYFGRGLYAKQVKRYLEFFPKDQMLFLRADDLYKNASDVLIEFYKFIGLEPRTLPDSLDVAKNKGGVPINMGIQRFLAKESLFKTLGKSIFPSPLRLGLRRFLEIHNRRHGRFPEVNGKTMDNLRRLYKKDLNELTKITKIDFSDWL